MTMDRHEPFEELISASLIGDLSDDEQRRLDAHLDGCAACRATLAAFADQRRIVAGLRHVSPPRDLGARVRTGIETGAFAIVPWWRRPATIFAGFGGMALVAGALLALVVLNGPPDDPQVGESTPTPGASVSPVPAVTTTPAPTAAPILPPPPPSDGGPPPSTAPTPTPAATPQPSVLPSPEPDVFLAITGPVENLAMTIRDSSGNVVAEAETPSGEPIAAELSPDGQWLAYITRVGESGLIEFRATRITDAPPAADAGVEPPTDSTVPVYDTVVLGRSVEGSPFLERLAWSSNGRYLAYNLATEAAGTDAWLFDTADGAFGQLTDTGAAYAASWVPGSEGTSWLWISTAGAEPVSHLRAFDANGGPDEPIDPAEDAVATADGVFLPLLSPAGSLAIYWTGVMEQTGDEWVFSEGGAPMLSEHSPGDAADPYRFTNERLLFSDVTIDRDAFSWAAIAWGPDSEAYAVWDTAWTGTPQSDDGSLYPDRDRVYFGHALDPDGLTQDHAIDEADIPDGVVVVDVKVSPTGRHLAVTFLRPTGGIGEAPRATLVLVTRNTGSVADEVEPLDPADEGWFGPAAFAAPPPTNDDR